jgi:hypothetical protein
VPHSSLLRRVRGFSREKHQSRASPAQLGGNSGMSHFRLRRVPHPSASHPSTLTPTQFRALLTGLGPIRATCPDRQFQPSSRVHTKTVLKDRRNAQTTHATFPEAAGIFRKPEGAGGVSYRQNEMSLAIRHPDSPRLRASVANAGHSPLTTRHPALSGVEGCISNRHSCRLETHINPCASMAPPFLIVHKIGVFRVSSFLRWGRHVQEYQNAVQL